MSHNGDEVAARVKHNTVTARVSTSIEVGTAVIAVVEDGELQVRAVAGTVGDGLNASIVVMVLVGVSCRGRTPGRRQLIRLVSSPTFIDSCLFEKREV